MLQAFLNVFKIPELRNKILFTLGMLVVFRIGHWIPIPGINQEQLNEFFRTSGGDTAVGRLSAFVAMFSGGNLGKSTIFGLGILPYISASIIFQLLASALPALKKLQEEGASGRQKIMEWTRYAAVGLCIMQSIMWLKLITAQQLVYEPWAHQFIWWLMATAALTAGTIFLMWLGEQIDRFGIGNGVSLIIMAGILTSMPQAVMDIYNNFEPGNPNKTGWMGVLLILAGFVAVVAGAVIMTVAQRRIPVQQAKHTRGRKVYGGQKSYLPLRVNHGGVMPVIFASSLMIFPNVIFSSMYEMTNASGSAWQGTWLAHISQWLSINFSTGEFPYIVCEVLLIYFFSYFWITVQFNPDEMAKQLRDHGSFIPGLRPGPRTAEYIETVMERITFVGAAFLAVLATMPLVVNKSLNVSWAVAHFLGGTGLLIVVSVCLDFVQRVEANLLMRNYAGFLGGNDDGSGPKIRGPRG